jgi:tetratricopeptide (TPR) repeat protein
MRWQRDLSSSYNNVGNILRRQGDLAEALAAYRTALAIRESLVHGNPVKASWQRDLLFSHNKVGNVLRDQGDLAEALAAYRTALAIAQRLAGQDPSHAGWHRGFALSCGRVARALLEMNDDNIVEAKQLIARGLDQLKMLAQAHPPTPSEVRLRRWLEQLHRRTQ